MNFSTYEVAKLALERAPKTKWCYLWIQPVDNTFTIKAFSLIPPFSKDNWISVGKITGSELPIKISSLEDKINWVLEMHYSFYFEEPTTS